MKRNIVSVKKATHTDHQISKYLQLKYYPDIIIESVGPLLTLLLGPTIVTHNIQSFLKDYKDKIQQAVTNELFAVTWNSGPAAAKGGAHDTTCAPILSQQYLRDNEKAVNSVKGIFDHCPLQFSNKPVYQWFGQLMPFIPYQDYSYLLTTSGIQWDASTVGSMLLHGFMIKVYFTASALFRTLQMSILSSIVEPAAVLVGLPDYIMQEINTIGYIKLGIRILQTLNSSINLIQYPLITACLYEAYFMLSAYSGARALHKAFHILKNRGV